MASQVKAKSALIFLDTNVLVYADDPSEPTKRKKATEIIVGCRREGTGVLSVQVLQEYFVSATRKLKLDLEIARFKVEFLSRFRVVQPTAEDVLASIDLHRLHRISFWDAMILRSAKQAGCRQVFTEDVQHGRSVDGVTIVNPFL